MPRNTITFEDCMDDLDHAIEFVRQHESQVLQHLRTENERLQDQLTEANHQLAIKSRLLDLYEERIHEMDDQLDVAHHEKAELNSIIRKMKKKRKLDKWLEQTMYEYQQEENATTEEWLDETPEIKRLKLLYKGLEE